MPAVAAALQAVTVYVCMYVCMYVCVYYYDMSQLWVRGIVEKRKLRCNLACMKELTHVYK